MKQILKGSIALILGVSSMTAWAAAESADLGPRPLFLVNNMDESSLKTKLLSCRLFGVESKYI